MVRGHLRANLVIADTAEAALAELGGRVPDLVLTSALLSVKDETALANWLETLDAAAAHVQTLTIPVLAPPEPPQSPSRTGIFSLGLLGDRAQSQDAMDGCDPAVFAEQCAQYLARTANDRAGDDTAAEVEAPIAVQKPVVDAPPIVTEPPAPVVSLSNHEPPPPPPQMTAAAVDGDEIDLTAMLDESVFQQLSEAIETVSRDSVPVPPSSHHVEAWPAMDFSPSPPPMPAAKAAPKRSQPNRSQPNRSQPNRSQPNRLPPRKPIQDEWGFFDPAQCGFSTLLAKLDEITRVASPLPEPTPPAGSHDASH